MSTSSFKQFQSSLIKKGFEAEFNSVNNYLVTIEIIGIPKQLHGKGYGSKIMSTLCEMADRSDTTLQLRPSASSTHSRGKLISFYSKFGFVENKGNNRTDKFQYMYRRPKHQLVEKILRDTGFSFLLLEKESTYKYGCVMLNTSNEPIKKLQAKIDKEDLYEDESDKFGLERSSHITLLYGLKKEVELKSVKDILDSFDFPKEIKVNKISLFDTDERYDVLKCDISMPILNKINKKLLTLPYKNDYPEYKAHITIAYIKKGLGKKYVTMFKNESFKLSTGNCIYKDAGGSKNTIKLKEVKLISEANANTTVPLITVDIQPAYTDYIHFDVESFTKFINSYRGNILYLFNGPDFGFESKQEIIDWLIDKGLKERSLSKIYFYEKNYGFFRNYLDKYGWDENLNIILRYMLDNQINDSRDIEFSNLPQVSDHVEEFVSSEDSINIPEVMFQLTKSNYNLCGGGKDECLLEIEVLLSVLKKKYNLIQEFIY
jgi:2'-5' RNA ligase